MVNLPRWQCQRCKRLISQKKQPISILCERCRKKSPKPNLVSLQSSHNTYFEFEDYKVNEERRCEQCQYELDLEDKICPVCGKMRR